MAGLGLERLAGSRPGLCRHPRRASLQVGIDLPTLDLGPEGTGPLRHERTSFCQAAHWSGKLPLRLAPIAQSAERLHGKEKVSGSIPLGGSLDLVCTRPLQTRSTQLAG